MMEWLLAIWWVSFGLVSVGDHGPAPAVMLVEQVRRVAVGEAGRPTCPAGEVCDEDVKDEDAEDEDVEDEDACDGCDPDEEAEDEATE